MTLGERRLLAPERLGHVALDAVLGDVLELRSEVAARGGARFARWRPEIARRPFLFGGRNLAHYLALREHDLRHLQTVLTVLGLSSLGRLEGRVLENLEAVRDAMCLMAGEQPYGRFPRARSFYRGERMLQRNTAEVFGPDALRRRSIMVTFDAADAADAGWVDDLVRRGMDVARINCAHDDADAWLRMARTVRSSADAAGRTVRLLFDLAGPSCRTGEVMTTDKNRLFPGDRLLLTRVAPSPEHGFRHQAASTLPEVLDRIEVGHAMWFDDGKLEGRVEARRAEGLVIEVRRTGPKGARIKPEKGLNFPDSELGLDPLTPRDLEALDAVAGEADMIGYSFVQRPADVRRLQEELARRRPDWRRQAMVLKIETRAAVRNLPELIVAAAGKQPLAVMIARGDLAVAIGFARLAEMQEELIWLCEAAHVPVIWATEVLENLRKKGTFARDEMTDAARAARAECVMLNKGPFVGEAIDVLTGLLNRMAEHQNKKTPRLRPLHAWQGQLPGSA